VSQGADEGEIRVRLRALANERLRFSYRRLQILLAREGHRLNHTKLFRLYRAERLGVRRRGGRKRARHGGDGGAAGEEPALVALDFVSDALACGRRFRVLVVDDYTRECLALARRCRGCASGVSSTDRQRQRHQVDLARDAALATRAWRRLALHRAGGAATERVRRELQWQVPPRMPQRSPVR